MEKLNITTTTYKFNDNYYIDIVELDDTFEAWIYNKDVGDKELMFSVAKDQPDAKIGPKHYTKELFIDLVLANNVYRYIADYFDEYERE